MPSLAPPRGQSRILTVTVPQQVADRLDDIGAAEGISRAAVARRAILRDLARTDGDQAADR